MDIFDDFDATNFHFESTGDGEGETAFMPDTQILLDAITANTGANSNAVATEFLDTETVTSLTHDAFEAWQESFVNATTKGDDILRTEDVIEVTGPRRPIDGPAPTVTFDPTFDEPDGFDDTAEAGGAAGTPYDYGAEDVVEVTAQIMTAVTSNFADIFDIIAKYGEKIGTSQNDVLAYTNAANALGGIADTLALALTADDAINLDEMHLQIEAIILLVLQTVGQTQFVAMFSAVGTFLGGPVGGVITGLGATFATLLGDTVPVFDNPHDGQSDNLTTSETIAHIIVEAATTALVVLGDLHQQLEAVLDEYADEFEDIYDDGGFITPPATPDIFPGSKPWKFPTPDGDF
jgi:hypothetical protein